MNIEINEDGIVSFTQMKILKQVKFNDFIEQLSNSKPLSTGFLPKDCIFYQKNLNKHIYIFEDTPQVRFLNWSSRASIVNVITYPISLPFIYWVLVREEGNVNSIRGRASLTPVRSLDQEVFNMGLPNFHNLGEGDMCRGSTSYNLKENYHTTIRDVVNKIWDTNWNGDLSINYPENVGSLKQWAEETIKDPLFWMKLKLKKTTVSTLGGMIEDH